MKLRLTNIRLALATDEEELKRTAARKLNVPETQIKYIHVIKKALDARKSEQLEFVYTVDVVLNTKKKIKINPPFIDFAPPPFQETLARGNLSLDVPPVVIGSGPAGFIW